MTTQKHIETADVAEFAQQQVMDAAGKAFDLAQSSAGVVAEQATKVVRKYPFAAIGLALGGGAVIGALGYRAMKPGKPSLVKQLGLAAIGVAAARRIAKMANRYT